MSEHFSAREQMVEPTRETESEQKAEPKREAILQAALELFAERTFAGCPVPDIAARAGVATGSIYRYFPSKEALANAVYQRWKRELKHRLVDEKPEGMSAREEFHWWWRGLSSFVTEHPVAFEFLELHHHDPYLNEESRALAFEIDFAVLEFVARGQQEGSLKLGAPALLGALVFGAFAGVVRGLRHYGSMMGESPLAFAEDSAWNMVAAAGGDSVPPDARDSDSIRQIGGKR